MSIISRILYSETHKKIVYLEFNVHCFTNKSYTLSIQYTLHDYSYTVQHKEYVIIIHINHSQYLISSSIHLGNHMNNWRQYIMYKQN